MECCGDPFRVGETVEWTLVADPDVEWLEAAIGSELASTVTHQEEHHGVDEGAVTRKGRIRSIRCAYGEYAPAPGGDQRSLYPVAGSAEIVHAESVEGTESAGSTRCFNGYLVEVELDSEV